MSEGVVESQFTSEVLGRLRSLLSSDRLSE